MKDRIALSVVAAALLVASLDAQTTVQTSVDSSGQGQPGWSSVAGSSDATSLVTTPPFERISRNCALMPASAIRPRKRSM